MVGLRCHVKLKSLENSGSFAGLFNRFIDITDVFEYVVLVSHYLFKVLTLLNPLKIDYRDPSADGNQSFESSFVFFHHQIVEFFIGVFHKAEILSFELGDEVRTEDSFPHKTSSWVDHQLTRLKLYLVA